MKTSEFIKYFEDEGYKVYKGNVITSVEDKNRNELFDISVSNNVDTYCGAFDNLPFEKQQEYYKVIFEYLSTPIEERKEEKKYYLKLKGLERPYNILNFNERTQSYRILTDDKYFGYKTQFTQSEIDDMPECYTHPAVWEQIEVEDN